MNTFLFRKATASILRPYPRRYAVLRLPFQVHIRNVASAHPKNHRIKHETVRILNPNGHVSEHQKLSSILASINLDTHVVRLVSSNPPTVTVSTKIEEKVRKIEKKAEAKVSMGRGKMVTKELLLTWFTEGSDLQYKLERVRDDLEKGNVRAEIQFLGKAGLRSPPRREMVEQLNKVAAVLANISTEWKERTINGRDATIYLQSKNRIAGPTKEELEDMVKQRLGRLERSQSQTR
jgi:translation initiation factor IF-3